MRFVSFSKNSGAALGVRLGDEVADLSVAAPGGPQDLLTVIAAGESGFQQAKTAAEGAGADARIPYAGLELLPPMHNPSKIICLGLNYVDHAAEGGWEAADYPTLFMRGPSSLVGHGQPIVRPRVSEQLDYEAELVAIIGKRVRHVSEADALDAVAGYSCFNDASIRDYQMRTAQWTIGKNFDATGGFGPDFVTADELPPGAAGLRIQARLNGKIMQDADTADMMFGVAQSISLISEALTLEPGDLLVMGTPSGVGFARTPPIYMKQDDTIEIDIESIGILSNPIENES
jgi:2-keto-4-pentenoate hydratase/2-oxohepta-3-ene-1,7-dioic acid hydratase in catechol pathway